ISWPKELKSMELYDMTYRSISAENEDVLWQRMSQLVEKSVYSPSVYTNLETFFRQQGEPKRADQIFVGHKERERTEVLKERFSKVQSFVLRWLVNYGRNPEWALGWSILPIVLCWWVFRRRDRMEARKPEDASGYYNAFWYSIDLFAPVINLQ